MPTTISTDQAEAIAMALYDHGLYAKGNAVVQLAAERDLLKRGVEAMEQIIIKLAEQQAWPDDWWRAELEMAQQGIKA